MAPSSRLDERAPVFAISVAAELSGMHPQTLRQYDRLGLVVPQRTRGRGRRYSARNVMRLREIQALSQDQGEAAAGHAAVRLCAVDQVLQPTHPHVLGVGEGVVGVEDRKSVV